MAFHFYWHLFCFLKVQKGWEIRHSLNPSWWDIWLCRLPTPKGKQNFWKVNVQGCEERGMDGHFWKWLIYHLTLVDWLQKRVCEKFCRLCKKWLCFYKNKHFHLKSLNYGCVSLGWSVKGYYVIQDHLDDGASKEPVNPLWARIHWFL